MTESREEFCKSQVKRWAGLREYPEDILARKELVNALWRWSESNEHAKKISDRVLESSDFCPTPAGLREIAGQVSPGFQRPTKVSRDCPHCHGTKFIHDVVRRWSMVAQQMIDYYGSAPCLACRPPFPGDEEEPKPRGAM